MQDQPQPDMFAKPTGVEILGVSEQPKRPRRTAALVLAGVLALGLVAGATWTVVGYDDHEPSAAGSAASDGVTIKGIKGLQVYRGLATDHVTGSVEYPQSPPVGGPHAASWLACGVYDEPVRNENMVHDLEHGTVWIAHRENLSEDDREALEDLLPDNGIMAPYPGLTSAVVLTVWGLQLHVDSVKDRRIGEFIEAFGNGETSPEPGTSCAGGLSNPDGTGQPVSPGTAV